MKKTNAAYYFHLDPAPVIRQCIVFYMIGAAGFIFPLTRTFFIHLTLTALALSFLVLLFFQSFSHVKRDLLVLTGIFLTGFIIEAIGVNTGLIFGSYRYGETLGFKIYQTPLYIGVNWVFITYTALSLAEKISKRQHLQFLLAPSLMLIYDMLLEQLAPKMDMWHWKHSSAPLQNYMAWWLIGLVFTMVLRISRMDTKNPLAIPLFICQFVFFFLLYLGLNLVE